MADIILNPTQSTWSKGMLSKVMSARNDTDIIAKGASILDNVVIMQQGGLRKRPCAKVSTDIGDRKILKGIFRLGLSLWAVYANDKTGTQGSIYIKRIGSTDAPVQLNFTLQLIGYDIAKLKIIQDGNTLLISGIFVVITYDPATNTFSSDQFIFNSLPSSPRLSNNSFFSNGTAAEVDIFYRGAGDATSLSQAQINGFYLAVGQTVALNGRFFSSLFTNNFSVGTLLFVNGLIIKIISWVSTVALGKVMYGSTPVQSLNKFNTVQSINDSNAVVIWNNVYGITATADNIFFQTNSWAPGYYPILITNFQNRIIGASVLGKTTGNIYQEKIPANNTTIWCSAAGNKFSYLQTTTDDASPFSVIISGDVSPEITNIVASDYLYAFTNIGAYAFINDTNSQFTTSNINLKKIGNHRCSDAIPISHDGQIFYVNETKNGIFSLTRSADSVLDLDRTILCPTFFKNVTQLAATNGIRSLDNNSDNSSYLLAIGDNVDQTTGESDGTCILSYQFVANQGLDGWSRWTFEDAQPVQVVTAEDRVFVYFDDGIIYEFVFGIYQDEINNRPPLITIKTNPFSFRDQTQGDILFRNKKYSKVSAYYLNTLTITINGDEHNVGSLFDANAPAPVDGVATWAQFDNYSAAVFTNDGQLKTVNITHQDNSNLILLALETQLEISRK